jgi:hypothetical protein
MERGLIWEMYETIDGESISSYTTEAGEDNNLKVEVLSANATNINGKMRVRVTNTSGHDIDSCYAKVDLYNDLGNVVSTEYIKVEDFKNGASREYDINFSAKNVEGYKIALGEKEPEVPDGIVNIMGWDVDMSNVFGMDLSRFKGLFNGNDVKNGLKTGWDYSIAFAKRVPWWAYAVGAGIIAYYTPMGYMFGFVL